VAGFRVVFVLGLRGFGDEAIGRKKGEVGDGNRVDERGGASASAGSTMPFSIRSHITPAAARVEARLELRLVEHAAFDQPRPTCPRSPRSGGGGAPSACFTIA
jgi:hypothetical protein